MGLIKSGPVDSVAFQFASASVSAAEGRLDTTTAPTVVGSYTNLLTGSGNGLGITQVGAATAFELSGEELDLASGTSKTCLIRHEITLVLYDPNAWLLLSNAMRINSELALQVRWSDGDTSTWNGLRFTVVPILAPIPNLAEILYADSATQAIGAAPTGFTALDDGTVYNDGGAEVTPNTDDDGQGLPLYASTSLEHILQVAFGEWGDSSQTTLDDGDRHSVAFRLPNGQYFGYNNVFVEIRRANAVGLNARRTTQWRLQTAQGNFTNSLFLPNQGTLGNSGSSTATHNAGSGGATPNIADCVFGLQVALAVSGLAETDFYIES